jgi:hypothetical protein
MKSVNKTEECMAATLETPVDQFTGLPLPIIPSNESGERNWHHHFHPEHHPTLQTLGGIALRNCRLQLINGNLHNMGPGSYHHYFVGPPLLDNEDEQFKLCLLACAGYIPGEGIDFSSGEPVIRPLSPEERDILRTIEGPKGAPYEYYRFKTIKYRPEEVRPFFIEYLLKQNLIQDKEDERDIDEFLHTENEKTKTRLGHVLLSKAAKMASLSVRDSYREARKSGNLHPLAPKKPYVLLRQRIGKPEVRQLLIPKLEARLLGVEVQQVA